jgi:hypothetical protein
MRAAMRCFLVDDFVYQNGADQHDRRIRMSHVSDAPDRQSLCNIKRTKGSVVRRLARRDGRMTLARRTSRPRATAAMVQALPEMRFDEDRKVTRSLVPEVADHGQSKTTVSLL